MTNDIPAGTAGVLHGASELDKLKVKYDAETAYGIAARELRKVNCAITRHHVEGFDLVVKALATGRVDFESAGELAEVDGRAAAESFLREIASVMRLGQ